MNFAQSLAFLLDQHGMTAYQLSKETGLNESMVNRWKRGERSPSLENAVTVANYFRVPLDYMTGRIDDPFAYVHYMKVDGEDEYISTDDGEPLTEEELKEIYAAESQVIADEAMDEATKLLHQAMGERFEKLLQRRVPKRINIDHAPTDTPLDAPREHDQPK